MSMSTRRRRRSLRIRAIALRLTLYLALAWGTLALLATRLFPGALAMVVVVALYTTLPLAIFLRFLGWPFYPGRAFRLLVVRPFWYAQLMLPLVSGAGLIGLILGAPFGRALFMGRALAAGLLALAVIVLILGYLGARRLVVRQVDAQV